MKKLVLTIMLSGILLLCACGTESAVPEQASGSLSESAGTEEVAEVPAAETQEPEQTAQAPEPAGETAEPTAAEPADAGSAEETAPAAAVLVVYFSRVGNTDFPADVDAVSSASLVATDAGIKGNAQIMAEWMADELGCEVWEITTAETYPVDYDETTDVAKEEQNEDARPALSAQVGNMADCSTIYLVYPNWWGDLPMAVYSFLESYDFSGKTIYVSATHEGSGFSGTVSTVEELVPGAQVIEGLSIRGQDVPDSEEEIRAWVQGNTG